MYLELRPETPPDSKLHGTEPFAVTPFVAPTERRESEIARVRRGAVPRTGECCQFCTTTVDVLQEQGALGRVWHQIGHKEAWRVAFGEMPGVERSNRPVDDCIAKPGWWDRRRRGGEGA